MKLREHCLEYIFWWQDLLPGIVDFVKEVLQDLGLEVFDDEAFSGVFVGGYQQDIFKEGLEQHPNLLCKQNLGYHTHLLKSTKEFHESKKLDDDPFEEAFSWLNEEEGEVTDEIIDVFLQKSLSIFFSLLCEDSDKRVVEFSVDNSNQYDTLLNLFPASRIVHVIEDPRHFICRKIEEYYDTEINEVFIKNQLEAWQLDLVKTRQAMKAFTVNYIETSVAMLHRGASDEVQRILSFLDEPSCPEVVEAISEKLNDLESWKEELSQDQISLIENILGDTFYELGFISYQAAAD